MGRNATEEGEYDDDYNNNDGDDDDHDDDDLSEGDEETYKPPVDSFGIPVEIEDTDWLISVVAAPSASVHMYCT